MKTITKRIIAVLLTASLVLFGVNPVTNVNAASKAPKKITLNKTSATIYVKGSVQLSVKSVSPSNADKSVTWSTSNKKLATVTSKGVVKGIKAGKVTITATSKKSKKVVAKCKVTVVNPTIKLSSKSLTLSTVGEKSKATLKATVKGASQSVSWKSSSSKVVTIDKKGNMVAKKSGSATITATANGVKATCKVKVTVPSIAISASKAYVYSAGTGSTVTLKAYYNGKSKSASWTSSNKSIATVSSKGVVTGKKAGKATITAKISKKTVKCTVYVTTQAVSLSPTSLYLNTNQYVTLKGSAVGKSKVVSWSSSNSKIATVTSKGVVKGIKAGTAYIYAKANGLTKSCKVTVVTASLSLNKSATSIFVGKTETLKATVTGTSKVVAWSSSNKAIATVDSKGVVKAVKAGTAFIYAKANGVTKACKVIVQKPTLTLDKSTLDVEVNKTATLKATVYGPDKTVTWSSSNTGVATVNNGVVTGVAAGTAVITATANGVSATCTVTVKAYTKTITINKDTSYLVSYDGSKGYHAVSRELSKATMAEYKDLYFDRLVNFLSANKDDVLNGWKNARDFTKTINGDTVTVEKINDSTKKVTVTTPNRTEVVNVKVEASATAGQYKVTFTRNNKDIVFDNVKFTYDANNYKVEFSKYMDYTLLVGVDGKSAEFKCGTETIAKYAETDSAYVFTYDKDLLNEFSQDVTEAILSETYSLGDILDATLFFV